MGKMTQVAIGVAAMAATGLAQGDLSSDLAPINLGCFDLATGTRFRLDEPGSVDECAAKCRVTRFFAVTGELCQCFSEAPDSERRDLGDCFFVSGTPQEELMQVFFSTTTPPAENCVTEAVRTFLVEEDNAPGGFDIITNTFKTSPFDLYSVDCGTNMYTINTDVSGDSSSLSTSISDASSFANERKTDRELSISASVSASGGLFGAKVAATVSGSFDTSQTDVFRSEGAREQNSQVLETQGVQRVASVEIQSFEAKRHFATFSDAFVDRLRTYRNSGFSPNVADAILEDYGQFAVTHGAFGGYVRSRATLSSSQVSSLFASDTATKNCFEASVSATVSKFGFTGSAEVGSAGCSATEASALEEAESSFEETASSETVVGGRSVDGAFEVLPETSTLLADSNQYPSGERKLELRLISDFLAADKVSPLAVTRSQITEEQFAEIGRKLEEHILATLARVSNVLNDCGCDEEAGGVPFLRQFSLRNNEIECECYDPQPPQAETEITVRIPGSDKVLTLCEVEVFDKLGNKLAVTGATQSSTHDKFGASLALDGRNGPEFFFDPSIRDAQCSHTQASTNPFWKARIPVLRDQIGRIEIFNRGDSCCRDRLNGAEVLLNGNKVFTVPRFEPSYVIPFETHELTVRLPGNNKILTLCEVEVYDHVGRKVPLINPSQSSTLSNFGANLALDGNRGPAFFSASRAAQCSHTAETTSNPFWRASVPMLPEGVGRIEIYNRGDSCCRDRLNGAKVLLDAKEIFTVPRFQPRYVITMAETKLTVRIPGNNKILTLCEVEVYDKSGRKVPLINPTQSSTLSNFGANLALDGKRGPAFFSVRRPGGFLGRFKKPIRTPQCSHTQESSNPVWTATIPLAREQIGRIEVFNRGDSCCRDRLNGAEVLLGQSKVFTVPSFQTKYTIAVDSSNSRRLRRALQDAVRAASASASDSSDSDSDSI